MGDHYYFFFQRFEDNVIHHIFNDFTGYIIGSSPYIIEWDAYSCYDFTLQQIQNGRKYLPKDLMNHIFKNVRHNGFLDWIDMDMPIEIMQQRRICPNESTLQVLLDTESSLNELGIRKVPVTIATLWCLSIGCTLDDMEKFYESYDEKDSLVCDILFWKFYEEYQVLNVFMDSELVDKDVFLNIICPMVQYTISYQVPRRNVLKN